MNICRFPSLSTVRVLICYGRRWIDLDAVDKVLGNTALHKISESWLFVVDNQQQKAIIELLVRAGAHVDCVNANGQTPLDIATNDETRNLLRSKQTLPRLKCLCARLINEQQLPFNNIWPSSTPMNTFLHLHGGLKRKRSMTGCSVASFDPFDVLFDSFI